MAKKKKSIGLIPKLILAIVLGTIVGQKTFLPEFILQIPVTFARIIGNILNYFIPLMIDGFIVEGIADLSDGAGKLLAATTGLSYLSTIIAGVTALLVATTIFPMFIDQGASFVDTSGSELAPIFEVAIPPMF